jgi:hypothetical protein
LSNVHMMIETCTFLFTCNVNYSYIESLCWRCPHVAIS